MGWKNMQFLLLASGFAISDALVLEIGEKRLVFDHMTANFGVQKYDVKGSLKIPNAEYGCEPFREAAQLNRTILLVKRGDCKFVEKAQIAQNAGAKALIVGDSYSGEHLVKMISPFRTEIQIPVVFIKGSDHYNLRNLLKANPTAVVELNKEGEQFFPSYSDGGGKSNIMSLPLIFLILMSALPMSWFLFRGIDRIRRCVRNRVNQQRFVNYATTLPVLEYKSDDSSETDSKRVCINSTCVICLEDFRDREPIKVLPCDHGFHAQCIIPWFERSGNCPVCKMHYNQLHSTGLREVCSVCCNDLGLGLYQRLRNPPEEEKEAEEATPMEPIASTEEEPEERRDTRVCIGEVMTPQAYNEESKLNGPALESV